MPAKGMVAGTAVDLQGWDAVNAALFDTVNAAIVSSGSTPPTFSFSNPPLSGAVDIKGSWKPWELVAGSDGETLAVQLPVAIGTATYPGVFATLDPATAGLTLDALNLAVSLVSGSAIGIAIGTVGQPTGKVYFELTRTSASTSGEEIFVGVAANATSVTFAGGFAYGSNGSTVANGQVVPPGRRAVDTWTASGQTVGVAVDFGAGKVWFRGPSGSWRVTSAGVVGDPTAGTGSEFQLKNGPAYYPAVVLSQGGTATINLGATPFVHTVPQGFSAGYAVSAPQSVILDGAIVSGTILLSQVPGRGTEVKLVPSTTSTPTSPAATVSTVTLNDGSVAAPPIQMAFDSWLKANLSSFANVFHTVDIGSAASAAPPNKFAWLAPTGFAYAAADEPSSTPTRSVFAILTMTDGRTAGGNLAAQVSPEIIAGMPTGSNAVLAISAERITEKLLLPGAQAIVNDPNVANFEIDALGTEVTNKVAMDWRPIKLADGTTVTPKIPAKGMTFGIEGRKIKLSFSGLSFDYPGAVLIGKETVTFGFEQSLYLTLGKRSDGRHVLVPTFADPDDATATDRGQVENLIVSYELDQTAQNANTALLITGIILSVITIGLVVSSVAGFVIKAGTAEAAEADSAANDVPLKSGVNSQYSSVVAAQRGYEAMEIPIDAQVSEVIYSAPPNAPIPIPPPPAPVVVDTLPASALPFVARNALRLAIFGGVAGMLTVADWIAFGLAKQMKAVVEGDFDKVDVAATVEAFLEEVLGPFEWPDTKTFTLKDIRLDGSLMFYGELA